MSGVRSRDYPAELEALGRNSSAFDTAEAKKVFDAHRESLQSLVHAYLCLRYLIDRGDVNAAPKGIRILYGKLVEGVGAVLFLLERGLPGPAAQVFRSTLETSVALQVVLRDVDKVQERALLFEEFLFVQRYEALSRTPVSPETKALAEANFERVRHNYHPRRRHSWAWKACPSARLGCHGVPENPNFREFCDFIGHPDFNHVLYGPLSETTHPVPGYEIWLRGGDGNMYVGPKSSAHVPMLARLTRLFSMGTLIGMLDFLKPPDGLALKVFFARVLLPPDSDEEHTEAAP